MIAACPKCASRYRVDESRVGPEGARIRCTRCEVIFRIRRPDSIDSVSHPGVVNASLRDDPQNGQSDGFVLLAGESQVGRVAVDPLLTQRGFRVVRVRDGVEAILKIQRERPTVVVLDRELPRMSGLEVCELVKRNESLRETRILMVGEGQGPNQCVDHAEFGPDVCIAATESVDGLLRGLAELGVHVAIPSVAASGSDPASSVRRPESLGVGLRRPSSEPQSSVSQQVKAPAESEATSNDGDPMSAERAKAERLARVVVSDIVLYQGDRFEMAVQNGNWLEMLEAEIEEGRKIFRQRIDERIRGERDFLMDELNRVAGERVIA
ncbi:MAG: zinc-ribbon domain-containing protein [Myxococcota bacterium]|nr:zinc-ribbon domain-containing protein [Myxococcota bacterium]